MRILSFILLSGLGLPVFANNLISEKCCPTCPRWDNWGLVDYNQAIYHPDQLPQENLLDCVIAQQRFVGY